MKDHEHWMSIALEEARKGLGLTSPNPPVGAVLVSRDGQELGRGWHQKAGTSHAEVRAVDDALKRGASAMELQEATLYVTLEPCSTHGRTPPCCALIESLKIPRVVVGAEDPNPHHAGAGIVRLRERGIEVTVGVLHEQCEHLIRLFAKWTVHRLPYVIAKVGQTLDGQITLPAGEGQWITSQEAREHAQGLRRLVDAIVVGSGTLLADNPSLTVRGPQAQDKQQPWRIVLTRHHREFPASLNLFSDAWQERTRVLRSLNLRSALEELARMEVTSVLIEGGSQVLASALQEGVVDEIAIYVAPRISGFTTPSFPLQLDRSIHFEKGHWELVGEDNVVYQGMISRK